MQIKRCIIKALFFYFVLSYHRKRPRMSVCLKACPTHLRKPIIFSDPITVISPLFFDSISFFAQDRFPFIKDTRIFPSTGFQQSSCHLSGFIFRPQKNGGFFTKWTNISRGQITVLLLVVDMRCIRSCAWLRSPGPWDDYY